MNKRLMGEMDGHEMKKSTKACFILSSKFFFFENFL